MRYCEEHPDANLLGALVEGSLDRRRRRPVLRHLADCDTCRRLAACANTVIGESRLFSGAPLQPYAPWAAWTSWAAWSPLRATWSTWVPLTAAATVALMASAVWLVPRHQGRVAPAPISIPVSAQAGLHRSAGAALAVRTTPVARRLPVPASTSSLASNAFILTTLAPVPTPNLTAGVFTAANEIEPVAYLPTSDATITPSIDFSPLMTGFQDQPMRNAPRAQLAAFTLPSGAPATSASASASASEPSDATPPSAPERNATGEAMFANDFAGNSGSGASLSGPFAPRISAGLGWALSKSGHIMHSVGGIWALVPVPGGIHFHAVQASEATIWAGGRADQLIVSHDHGQHWRAVQLPGAPGHATIATINFTDPQHGIVVASTGASWQTSDAGDHWTPIPPA